MSLWNKVWSLAIPSKAKHLVWRICDNLIPEYRIIRRENVRACYSCNGNDADVTHTLLRCEYAQTVWFACPLSLRVDKFHFNTVSEFASVFCHTQDADIMALWAMVAWGIWFNKHSQRQGKGGLDPVSLVEQVLNELNKFQTSNVGAYIKQVRKVSPWIVPPKRWVKINCNVSYFSSNSIGIGCVIIDEMGEVLGSFAEKITSGNDFLNMGAQEMAMYHSLLFGLDMGFRSIMLESDYQPVVHKFQSLEWEKSEAADIIKRCKNIQSDDYHIIVRYVTSDDNHLAESIAEYAEKVKDFTAWIDDLPPLDINFD